ncbi:MAG TPA: ArsC/Spx/MgsR family protein [Methylosinus sp.]|jgi:nitrogenase-associated protein
MADVIFYEKPGCASNARQKALLVASGHALEVRNLLEEPWSVSSLRPFFGETPVREWFNPAAPRVKSGEIDLETITPQAALVMMIVDPILIRRPLMKVGGRCEAGFDPERIGAWIGLKPTEKRVDDLCSRTEAAALRPEGDAGAAALPAD